MVEVASAWWWRRVTKARIRRIELVGTNLKQWKMGKKISIHGTGQPPPMAPWAEKSRPMVSLSTHTHTVAAAALLMMVFILIALEAHQSLWAPTRLGETGFEERRP